VKTDVEETVKLRSDNRAVEDEVGEQSGDVMEAGVDFMAQREPGTMKAEVTLSSPKPRPRRQR